MKKKLLTISILGALAISQVALAAKPTQEEKDARKSEREEIIAEKKAAQEEKITEKKEEITERRLTKLCERVEKRISQIRSQSEKREKRVVEKLERRRGQVTENRVMQNEELQERRQNRDMQREQFYVEMTDMAENSEQIDAIEEFKSVVETAIQDRRNAIDAATEKMRAGMDVLVDQRVTYVEELYAEYQEGEDAIFVNIESYCGNETTEDDVKNFSKDVNTELKELRETFKKGVQDQRNINEDVKVLSETRKNAVEQATNAFKEVVAQAQIDLKEGFGLEELNDLSSEDGSESE